MQDYTKTNRLSINTFLFFVAVLFIAYLPISSFLFFLKNDAFNGYFPPKFFMSESIHAGYLPLWNPYINFGIPQYGDMSGGFWSPVTWLIASTVGYNAYTLTIEALLYILVGGIGMYQLTGIWNIQKNIRIIAGVAFMCCGYHVGHLQHFNWLSGSAFLPWCFWSYQLLLKQPSPKIILGNVLAFYMLLSSAHPGISIGAFYFFTALLIFHFGKNESAQSARERFYKIGKSHIIFIVALILLSAGMIIGYADILPHFVRGEKISLENALSDSTSFRSWISTLLPFATVKNATFFNTDLSMRDCYFSLVLLLFFMGSCIERKSSWQKFLLIIGLLFALLSAGGFLKTLAYKFIPLIGYVRLNGEFRIFALLAFIIVASIELDNFFKQNKKLEGGIKWLWYTIETILISASAWAIFKSISEKESFIYELNKVTLPSGITGKLKFLIDAINFYDTIWIQGIIQLLILWFIKYALKEKNLRLIKMIVVADLVLASLLNIPFTGAGKASLAQVQLVLNKSPKGIPIPYLQPITKNDTLETLEKDLLGNWSMYNKQIGTLQEVPYPIQLKNSKAFFTLNENGKGWNYNDQAFLFLKNKKEADSIVINSFSPDKITLSVFSEKSTALIFQQNYYPHWFYQKGDLKNIVQKDGVNFMSIPVDKGINKITIIFDPKLVKNAMVMSALLFIIYLWLFIWLFLKPTPFSPS
jgi:hypothetical protein